MRMVFIGATQFGIRCLSALPDIDGVEVVGAVTAPKRFAISYRPDGVVNVLHADVASLCEERGWPCVTIDRGMDDAGLLDTVAAWNPDAFLVAGWYHMVPRRWRELAPAYGLHASLLPDYSGGAPLVWAIINGETRTGISFFRLGDGVDDGPIVGQAVTDIGPDDTIATLYARIEALGVELIRDDLPRLAKGSAVLLPQDEARRRTMPQRSPEDGLIQWSWPAKRVHDFVRAQTRPYPGAFFMHQGHKWTIWAARLSEHKARAGTIGARGDAVLAGCGDERALELCDLAIDGTDVSQADAALRLGGGGLRHAVG